MSALAESLGGLECVRADVMRKNSVFDLVGDADDVLISTVGPFMKWGAPAVRAAIAAGCTYLDSTGEPVFIRRVFEEFGPPAARRARALLTAMGYDFAPGALAGALALEEAGDEAVRVDVGYYALGGGPTSLSSGTRESVVGVTLARQPRLPRGARARGPLGRARALVHGRRQAGARRSRSAAPSTTRCRRPIRGCARSTSTWAGSGRWRARCRPGRSSGST